MDVALKELAEKLGICTHFSYVCNGIHEKEASAGLLRFLIESFGYKTKTEDDIRKSMERIEKKRWQYALDAIYVRTSDNKNLDIVLTEKETQGETAFFYAPEGSDDFRPLSGVLSELERRQEARTVYVKMQFAVTEELAPGYYDVEARTAKGVYKTILAVTPRACYELQKNGKDKLFGFALQLYSLKSRRNWGVGDFTDLAEMADMLANSGGDIIGLNPLNVLEHENPEYASPYASTSRLFLNPIYIDVEKVPFYEADDKDEAAIAAAKAKENIDYTTVYNTKIAALRRIFARVLKQHKSDYYKEFMAFMAADTGELHRLAVFQTFKAQQCGTPAQKQKKAGGIEKLAIVGEMEKFVSANAKEIEFFKFLQFEADRQLRAVEAKIKERGLAVGLYRDLPVGVSKNSAEVWSDKYLYMQESGTGAPPDNSFPIGQKWMLGAFNPFELKERAYKPFIRILRANMRYAGAIRIDHVMGLSRLYLIPDKGEEGTYLMYNAEDMFNILALESHLNKCAVVGECIGNVSDGFKDMLKERNIYALGVLWVERKDEDGTLKTPQEYDRKYFASVGTHDMPPLKAWWFGREIGLMKELGLYSAKETEQSYHWREHERWILLQALDNEQVWPEDRRRQANYLFGEGYPEGLEEAVHSYMAKTNSEVFMLQPEDIFQSEKVQNLPGTDIPLYPNWRSRLPVDVEDMEASEAYRRNIAAVKKWR